MKRRRSDRCSSDLKLDRWLSGELTAAEVRDAELHEQGCEACRSRRMELLDARSAFGRDAPPFTGLGAAGAAALASSARTRLERSSGAAGPGRGPRRWAAGAAALAVAAALVVAIGVPWRDSFDVSVGTRTKGGVARLGWVVRRGDRVFAGRPDEPLRAGDGVRFTISAREPVFVAIMGLDASGAPGVFFPDGERLSRVEAGSDQLLAAAIELDTSPGPERLYAVYCRGPELVSQVRDAIARSTDAPALPGGCTSERWLLPKERR